MANPLIKFIQSVTVQTAVYWGTPTPDGYGGKTFADPVEIKCRWDGITQMIKGADGREIVSRASILLIQDVDEGGYIFLGSLTGLDSADEDNPEQAAEAWEILKLDKTPLFRSTTEFVRVCYL